MRPLRLLVVAALAVAVISPATTAASAATTDVVSPSAFGDWTFDESGAGATASFRAGPGTPPLGLGSYGFEVSNGTDGAAARNAAYDGTRLADLTTLSYSTYVSDNESCQAAYVSLRIDEDADGVGDNSIFFEPCYQDGTYPSSSPIPNQGSVQLNTWQDWDALAGGWWDANSGTFGPPLVTFGDYLAGHPDAEIIATGAGGGLRVFGGFGVPITGAFDAVTVGVTGPDTTFDFEPDTTETTVTVTPSAMDGWAFFQEVPVATGHMVAGPDTPPLGIGSARMTLDATGRMLLLNGGYAGTRFDQIVSLGYSTYRASPDAGNNLAISLQFDTDYDLTDADVAWQGRLVFEPYQGAGGTVPQDTWQTWDPLEGLWWASGAPGNGTCPQASPCTWGEVLAAFPDAGIRLTTGPGPGLLHLKAGGPAPGFDGNADAFTIAVDDGAGTVEETTYDFEPDSMEGCPVAHDAVNEVTTLLADCTVDETFVTRNGWTFDGGGHTITAVDPAEGHFLGAVVQAGPGPDDVTIEDLTVTTVGLVDICDGAQPVDNRLSGILFDGVGGSIADNTVFHIQQGTGSGCQEGNAIVVTNLDGAPPLDVAIERNVVFDYIKNGFTVSGDVSAVLHDNTATGNGPVGVPLAAQNGIQISFGASAELIGNTATAHDYTPKSFQACGLLLYKAGGVRATRPGIKWIREDNTFVNNEVDICNFGKGGDFSPDG